MVSRYDERNRVLNSREIYRELFESRGLKYIRHYDTANLEFPTSKELALLDIETHVWSRGDRLWKISSEYYGDPRLWWLLGWFNKKPTDGHFEIGDLVQVPFPLERVLDYMGV